MSPVTRHRGADRAVRTDIDRYGERNRATKIHRHKHREANRETGRMMDGWADKQKDTHMYVRMHIRKLLDLHKAKQYN